MKKRVTHYKGPDWFDYPSEWDEQGRILQAQWDADTKASIITSKKETMSPSIESTEAKKDDERQIS